MNKLNHNEICDLLLFSPSNIVQLFEKGVSNIKGTDPLGIDKDEDYTDYFVTSNIIPGILHKELCYEEAKEEDKKPLLYK